MKKFLAIALALTMLLAFTACDSGEKTQETTPAPVATQATEVPLVTETVEPETTEAAEAETEAPVAQDPFFLTFNGVQLVPGTLYDSSKLPSPSSVYQVPSCAIEGTDNVYSFNELDITAFNDGTQEIIYSIAIFDPNVCTDEGLYLGDDVARVIELYGENYTENGTAMVYVRGNTQLCLILQNGFIVDIEFRWITD